jgi:hypothetical protein
MAKGVKNALCLNHTASSSWHPRFGVYSILSQLQSVFSDENFSKAKMSLGDAFRGQLNVCRAQLSRYRCAVTGHQPESPRPNVPLFNGPFAASDAGRLRAGALHGAGKFRWLHRYQLQPGAVHTFSILVEHGGCTVTLQDPSDDSLQWVFETTAGSGGRLLSPPESIAAVSASNKINATRSGSPARDGSQRRSSPQPKGEGGSSKPGGGCSGSLITFTFTASRLNVSIDGKPCSGDGVSLAPATTIQPTIYVQSNKDIISCAFAVDSSTTTSSSPAGWNPFLTSTSSAVASSSTSLPRCCYVSLASEADDVLGLVVEIPDRYGSSSSGGVGGLPTEASIVLEGGDANIGDALVGARAFDGLRGKQKWGRRFDGLIPLLLDAKNSSRALPELKRQVTLMCRNPAASAAYTPPYKPSNATVIFPLVLSSVVRTACRNVTVDTRHAFSVYTRVLQCFAALVLDAPQIAVDAARMIAAPDASSGVIFALSPLLEHPWPAIVEMALRSELKDIAAARGETGSATAAATNSDSEIFSSIPRARRKLFSLAAAFARALRRTSVMKLLQELTDHAGDSSPEAAAEVLAATELPAVSSWDGLCSMLGVNLSARDLL